MSAPRFYRGPFACALLASFGLLAHPDSCQALTVTQPVATTVVSAGDDYATQVPGNAWDMNDAVDIDVQESVQYVNGMGFGGGIFTGTTATNSAGLYPLFMGLGNTINLTRGFNFPIDTARYRYVTFKLKDGSAGQFANFIFYPGADVSSYGVSQYFSVPQNQWAIVKIDLVTDLFPGPTSIVQWHDQAQVMGLRLNPANGSGVPFDLDWIRLTAPATPLTMTPVTWTDSGYGGTYNLSAIDSGGVGFTLATGVSGTSTTVDLTFLQPGQYTIQVARSNASASATSATFHIDSPPQVAITAPGIAGELSQDFATAVVGNAWGPFSAADFSSISNFKNVSYANPVGSFYGRPTSSDTGWTFNLGGHTIDTGIYRSLCFKMMVFGPRDFSGGAVARIFWGNGSNAAQITTSKDLVLDDNFNDTVVSQYCIADLANVPLEPGTNGGTWSGTKSVLRIDPDEFTPPNGCSAPDTCHDVRLDSVTLSPFAQADPAYTFQWTLADTDGASSLVDLYLDPDKTPTNGNEVLIHSSITPTGSGSYAWPGSSSVDYGTYNVLIVADDGISSVSQYAGGPLIVGARDGIFRNGFDASL